MKLKSTWSIATFAALFALGSASWEAQAVGIANPVGAAALNGSGSVVTFVTAVDGTLRLRGWDGSWGWTDHGSAATGIASGVGAVWLQGTVPARPVAFTIGFDGNLWSRDYNYSASGWSWYFHGLPAGVNIAMSVGATVHHIDGVYRPLALIVGSDGNLWGRGVTNSGWVWDNYGSPAGVNIVRPVGAITVGGSSGGSEWRPYGFVIGSDGNLWSASWNGNVWSWANHGAPAGGVAAGVGAVTISTTRPFVFVTGNDGNLWSRSWSGSAWVWHNHGLPGGQSIANGMGVTSASSTSRPFAFVKAADGNIWSNDWTGSAWRWFNHGAPSGVGVGASVGAVAVNTSNPYLFFLGSDGNLWLRWWSGSAWGWYNHGQP